MPRRLPGSRCGALDIDSMPPATTTSQYPAVTCCAACAIAASPDRHSLLPVVAGTLIGPPPATAASRAGFGPTPAWTTFPKMTASTWSPVTPARSSAARITVPPRAGACSRDRPPSILPIGVRAPATRTGCDMGVSFLLRRTDRAVDDGAAAAGGWGGADGELGD